MYVQRKAQKRHEKTLIAYLKWILGTEIVNKNQKRAKPREGGELVLQNFHITRYKYPEVKKSTVRTKKQECDYSKEKKSTKQN